MDFSNCEDKKTSRCFSLAHDSSGLSKGCQDRDEYLILISTDFYDFISLFSP